VTPNLTPIAGASAPRVKAERHKPVVLDATQVHALLEAARGHRLYAALVLMAYTGARRGEVLALGWPDVEGGRVLIANTVARVDGSLVLQSAKTEDSVRSWALAAPVVEALREHRKAQAAERLAMGSAWHEHGLVFPSEVGTLMDPRNFARWVTRTGHAAGLTGVHPHALRHTAATLALGVGVPLTTVSKMLGHSSVAITADVYGSVLEAQQRQAADALAGALGSLAGPGSLTEAR
jgi:integrase